MKVIAFLAITALFVAGSGQAAASAYQPCSWEKQIVAACLVLEAAEQDAMGTRGVASVILNRTDEKPLLGYAGRQKTLRIQRPQYGHYRSNGVEGIRLATYKRPRTTACGDPCCKLLMNSILRTGTKLLREPTTS